MSVVVEVADAMNRFLRKCGVQRDPVKPSNIDKLINNKKDIVEVVMRFKDGTLLDITTHNEPGYGEYMFSIWLTSSKALTDSTYRMAEFYNNGYTWIVANVKDNIVNAFIDQYKRERKMEGRRGLMDI